MCKPVYDATYHQVTRRAPDKLKLINVLPKTENMGQQLSKATYK
jgi:hypothetical protein